MFAKISSVLKDV